MPKTRFDEILSAIGTKDYGRFTDMVNSPYFNKNARVTMLWTWIMENPKVRYSKEELMDAMTGGASPGTELKSANFRMVLSDFVKLGEKFLLEEMKKGDASGQRSEIIEIMRGKSMIKGYEKYLRESGESARHEKNRDSNYYYNLYSLECEILQSGKAKDITKQIKRIDEVTDLIWICMKLDNMVKHALLKQNTADLSFSVGILDTIEKNHREFEKKHPVIYSRYLIVKMLQDKKYFEELEKYTKNIKSSELTKYNYDAMLAWCRTNGLHEKEFELIKFLDKKKLLLEDGIMHPNKLIQIVDSGLAAQKLPDVINFYNKYTPCLPEDGKQEIILLIHNKLLHFKRN